MMPLIIFDQLGVWAIFAGLLSHWLHFLHGEHHMQAPLLALMYLASMILVYGCCFFLFETTFTRAFYITIATIGWYGISLFTSMVVYRLYFHRLRSFPGPVLARISKLWHVWHVRDSKNHRLLNALNNSYGTFVRTGPAELTIFSAEAIHAIDRPGTLCTKPDWYDNILPMKAMINLRDPEEHDRRRRIYEQAFSSKALKNYEGRIVKYADQLDEHLQSTAGNSVHCNKWFLFFAYDLIGDLALGRSFNMLQEKEWDPALVMSKRFMAIIGITSPVPWVIRLGKDIPWLSRDWNSWKQYCVERMEERISMDVSVPDIYHYLLDASQQNNSLEKDHHYLEGDAMTLILAGGDTTATVLIFTFALLCRYPEYIRMIRAEVRTVPSLSDFTALQKLPILKSVLLETMRLFPPVPTGPSRLSPPDGITISGKWIPPNTAIFAPKQCIARFETCFEKANDFVPERWTTRPEMIKDKRAYAPFSQGRFSCVGKGLAMKSMTYVVAMLISKYEVKFGLGEDGARSWKEMNDHFSSKPGKLNLVFDRLNEV